MTQLLISNISWYLFLFNQLNVEISIKIEGSLKQLTF